MLKLTLRSHTIPYSPNGQRIESKCNPNFPCMLVRSCFGTFDLAPSTRDVAAFVCGSIPGFLIYEINRGTEG